MKIDASSVEIEERGVKLRLTVVDTPGFGDSINTEDWSVTALVLLEILLFLSCCHSGKLADEAFSKCLAVLEYL